MKGFIPIIMTSFFYLVQLIRVQNQIRKLDFYSYNNMPCISGDLKYALLLHSNSIIEYKNDEKDISNNSLIPNFQNLKILILSLFNNVSLRFLKTILLPKI